MCDRWIHHKGRGLLLAVLGLIAGCQLGRESAGIAPHKKPSRPATTASAAAESTEEQTLDLQLALARSLEKQGDLQRAADLYQGISSQHPKDGRAVHRLAIVHDQQAQFDKSAELFRKALKLQPGNPDIFCDLGYSQYLQQRWSESEMNLRQALALAPEHRRAHNQLGLVLAQLDRRTEALAEFRKAGGTAAEAHLNTALVLSMNGRLEDARREYEFALEEGAVPDELHARLAQLDQEIARNESAEGRETTLELIDHDLPATSNR